ncbi:MAG: glycosyltransferase [Pseudomonadota bacterium]|nr:glycosyltransferase [Pseudomonadota bacterium]
MISVIFPTRNRAELLGPALDSVVSQTLPPEQFEIIVVDNGSTDHTAEIVNRYKKQVTNLSYVYAKEPGLHIGRHEGMLSSKGEILVFADDDIEAFPTWLESIEEAFQEPNVAMVGGNNLPMFLEPPPPWLLKMWEQSDQFGIKQVSALSIIEFPADSNEISPYQVWGCNYAIRKKVLLSAGGFHPDGMPKELIRFRGDGETHVSRYVVENEMKCIFHAGASVYHKVTPERMTHNYFRMRGFNQGISNSFAALRNNKVPDKKNNRNLFRRAASWCFRKIRDLKSDRNINQAIKQMREGQKEGYAYHQKAYQEDTEVRAWVHREQYY